MGNRYRSPYSGEVISVTFVIYERLSKLLKNYGPQQFGKICQALLELTLRKIGFETRGREVERPDIVAERENNLYAIEAKVQAGSRLSITQRDLDGLREHKSYKAIPVIAALLLEPYCEWIMIDARSIKAGNFNKLALHAYVLAKLNHEVNQEFLKVVTDYFDLAIARGASGLRELIEKRTKI